jgi:hypothetical protein
MLVFLFDCLITNLIPCRNPRRSRLAPSRPFSASWSTSRWPTISTWTLPRAQRSCSNWFRYEDGVDFSLGLGRNSTSGLITVLPFAHLSSPSPSLVPFRTRRPRSSSTRRCSTRSSTCRFPSRVRPARSPNSSPRRVPIAQCASWHTCLRYG